MIDMPWKKIKKGNKWLVVKKEGGKVVGTHDSEDKANKQLAALHSKTGESMNKLDFMAVIESKTITEREGTKWMNVKGTALTVGESRNKKNYMIQNLKENNGKMFNVLVGHRMDYDNPDHNVGEGTYNLVGEQLKYSLDVKNTTNHPDIVEQINDGLVAPSVQGGYEDIKVINDEKGKFKHFLVEGLHIPLLAMVNKHVRGVEGATIESAIAERVELENEEESDKEGDNMEEVEALKKKLEESEKLAEEKNKELLKATEAMKVIEEKEKEVLKLAEAKKEADRVVIIDKLVEAGKKREDIAEMTLNELKIIESYEFKYGEGEPAEESDSGNGIVNIPEGAGAKNKEAKDFEVDKFGNLVPTTEYWTKFNDEVRERTSLDDK